ncbi:MAG: ABC transporter permease, partial [Deltaproteobacteria bacterium]
MRRDWSYWLSSNRGPLIAAALFVAMFTLFVSQHPAGFSLNIVNTAANKGAL